MENKPFETICIVGAGFMGAQIGLYCAAYDYTVWLVDTSEEILKQAAQSHIRDVAKLLKESQVTLNGEDVIFDHIHFTTDIQEGTSSAGLVIEAVPEDLEIKRRVFAQLDQVCPDDTILATNSSSIRASSVEDATSRPDKVLNLHFYAPVWKRPMVDLMRGTATSDETIERIRCFSATADLTPLMVHKESTGFVFNRVWRAVKKETLHLVDDGVASHEDVDRAWMLFTGMSIGPFGIMDMIGLDVIRDIETVYYHESGDESDAPPQLLLDKIKKGELGIKTGRGFYNYPHPAFKDSFWLKGNDPE